MSGPSFFSELKRRNIYKVAAAYAVIAWLLIQAASILFPTFEVPTWLMKVFIVIVPAGFVIALLVAWTFEMTPNRMKRTENISPNEQLPRWSKHKFGTLIVTISLLAVGLLVFQLWRSWSSEKSIAVLRLLEQAYAEHNGYDIAYIKTDRLLTPLHNEPRFQALVAKVFSPKDGGASP